MHGKPTIELLESQADFVTDTSTMFLGLVGGYRAGKTYSLCHRAIYMASKNIGYRGALLEPTHGMLKRVLVPTMIDILDSIGLPYTYRSSDPHGITLHFPNGNVEILLMASESYKRVAGVTLAWFGVDEFDLIDTDLAQDAWKMLVSRLTNANVMSGFVTSTPEGYKFLYQFFVADANDEHGVERTDRRLITARTIDNPYIDPAYIERMYTQYTSKQLEAYLNGEFVNLVSGSVYDQFDRALNGTSKTLADYPKHILHIGLDFNINNMASTVFIVDRAEPHALKEHIGAQNTRIWIENMKKEYPDRTIYVYPDSSGASGSANADQSSIAMIKQAGFEVKCGKANPRIELRVGSVNAKICNANNVRSFFINPRTCPETTRGLEQQAYDPSTGKPDKKSGVDHTCDAVGYFMHNAYPLLGRATLRGS